MAKTKYLFHSSVSGRGEQERNFYFKRCGNDHIWDMLGHNCNNKGITLVCRGCGVLATSKPRLRKVI